MAELDDQAKEAFVAETVGPMAQHTYPVLLTVSGAISESEGSFVGSGFRFSCNGRRFFATAAHVLREASDSKAFPVGPVVSAGYGVTPWRAQGAPVWLDDEGDLALIQAGGDYPETLTFWSADDADDDHEARARDYLFVHGYPEKRSRFSPALGGLVAKSLPYGVMEREDDLPELSSWEFAMDFDPSSVSDAGALVDPPGMSGSPVFRVGAAGLAVDHWSPSCARLVGVVTKWNTEKRVLIATTVERLLTLART